MEWQEEQQRLYKERQAEQERIRRQQQAEAAARQREGLMRVDEQRQAALQEAARKLQEEQQSRAKGSPIEDMFFEAWGKAYPSIELKRQYPIGKYRVDFAHIETCTVIELDGYTYHSTKKDRNKDYARQQDIEAMDWVFVRFTGSQVFAHVEACIRHAYKMIIKAR